MAIYHLSVQVVSRGQGKSCIAAAAYRAGEKLHDERQSLNHDYTRKQGIESEIIVPLNAPNWVNDRERLWNEVDKKETRCNSRTAREINIALPIELSKEEQKQLIREYVKESFVDKGMVADVCFHFNDEKNPHCHVMLTTREISQNGFTKKNRDWDKKEKVEEWREQWAKQANKILDKAGCNRSIDHRSYKDQGIDQVPTIHLGKTSSEMKKKNLDNPRVEINNQIRELNKQKIVVLKEYRELKDKLKKELDEEQRYSNLDPEEKAAVKDAEGLIGEPQTYENSKKILDKLAIIKQDKYSKLTNVESETRKIKERILDINNNLLYLKESEIQLNELPKNIFGHYKDKNSVKIIESQIQTYNDILTHNGYKSEATIKLNQEELDELEKSSKKLKSDIESLRQGISTISLGVEALKYKELTEFKIKYKEKFPQAEHLRYNDIQNIKLASEVMGKFAPIEEIRATYRKNLDRIDNIDDEIRNIEAHSQRLKNAKECFETIDKYKDIADKWDTKLFGRENFQKKYKDEKWSYDDSIERLKEYWVDDKLDLKKQEHIQESDMNNLQFKLKPEKEAIIPSIDVLKHALRSLDDALSTEESAQRQRQEELIPKKHFKRRELENEWEPEM